MTTEVDRLQAEKMRIPCFVACPNIVDHSDGPSLANPKSRARISKNFMRAGASSLDWSSAVKNPIKVSR